MLQLIDVVSALFLSVIGELCHGSHYVQSSRDVPRDINLLLLPSLRASFAGKLHFHDSGSILPELGSSSGTEMEYIVIFRPVCAYWPW